MAKRVFLSVGDFSASNYLYHIFKGQREFELYGITDDRLESIGVKSVGRIEEISATGLIEVLSSLKKIREVFKRSLEKIRECDSVILCDAPGFNLRLLKRIKKKKVIYFISPQVWVWGKGRAELIAQRCKHLVVILPFEEKIYKAYEGKNFKVHYLGHPLVDLAKPKLRREEFFKGKFLGIFAGSRWSEVKVMGPYLLKVFEEFSEEFYAILPTFPAFYGFLKEKFKGVKAKVLLNYSYETMAYSEASLITSGTASLEAGLLKNPHLVLYRVNPITYLIAKTLIRPKFLSLVNILLKEEVVPEVIQRAPEVAKRKLIKVLEERERIKRKLENLREILGGEGVINRLRQLFFEII